MDPNMVQLSSPACSPSEQFVYIDEVFDRDLAFEEGIGKWYLESHVGNLDGVSWW